MCLSFLKIQDLGQFRSKIWMLKFWSLINCFFMHWTKKLTLAKLHIQTAIKTQINLVPCFWADWTILGSTEKLCNFSKVSPIWRCFFSFFHEQKEIRYTDYTQIFAEFSSWVDFAWILQGICVDFRTHEGHVSRGLAFGFLIHVFFQQPKTAFFRALL